LEKRGLENGSVSGGPADAEQKICITKKSPYAFYIAGGAWFLYAMLFPMYRWFDFLLAAVVCVGAYLLAVRLLKPVQVWVRAPQEKIDTGDAQTDALIAQGRAYVRRLRAANERIDSQPVSEKLARMEHTVDKIFDYIAVHPEKTPSIRRFMEYYLPTTLKILESYAEMEEQGIAGENISESMQRTEQILDTINIAFDRQLDGLFSDQALDITTDITVLENMLAAGGIPTDSHF